MSISGSRTGHVTGRGTTHRWLALVFAVSVLFCHGWFGASHVTASSPTPDVAPPAPVHESHESHHASSDIRHGAATAEHDIHDSHAGMSDGSYFAAFFVALLWSLTLLLRPAARTLSEVRTRHSYARFAYPGSISPPGRPTPQLLQVFRL